MQLVCPHLAAEVVAVIVVILLAQIGHGVDLGGLPVGLEDLIGSKHGPDHQRGDQNGQNPFLCLAH